MCVGDDNIHGMECVYGMWWKNPEVYLHGNDLITFQFEESCLDHRESVA